MFKSSIFVGESFRNADIMSSLEHAFNNGTRIRVWYGDSMTGSAWPEENDVLGYVGRSTGNRKIPLLIFNQKSSGGGGILQDCIVRIDTTQGKTLYKHNSFNAGSWYADTIGNLWLYGEVWATFKSEEKAIRHMQFMQGKRYNK